ncbi:hypothetical protein K1719_013347 [Acacia pycnantha]|nr:hypothetical protein K1719_013347 [Acacia pycnantha]
MAMAIPTAAHSTTVEKVSPMTVQQVVDALLKWKNSNRLLGKQFFKKKKIPVPVDLKHKNSKEQIERARSSAFLFLRTGTCSVVSVAKVPMERNEIVANVTAEINVILELMPEGHELSQDESGVEEDGDYLEEDNEDDEMTIEPVVDKKKRKGSKTDKGVLNEENSEKKLKETSSPLSPPLLREER